jgi:hypothetical protein
MLAALSFLAAASGAWAARYALVVGINHYDPAYGAGDLSACINDANGVRNTAMLADPNGRWQAGNIAMVTDAQATKSAIRSWLQTAAAATQPGDLVVYFQSSHGGRSTGMDTYLCTYNASYTDTELGADLALFNPAVNVIVIVDACHSGGLFKDDEGWPFAEQTMAAYMAIKTREYQARGEPVPRALGANIAFMTACEYDEYSYEGGNYGVYTGCLLDACGKASADLNGNGQYEFWELHYYAAVNALQQRPQHAQYYNYELLNSIQARAVGGGGGGANVNNAYVYAYYGLSYLGAAYNTYGAHTYLSAAYTYANYAHYFAYYALAYYQAYGNDYGCAAQAYMYAYYGYLYGYYAYAYETGDAYSYYGAIYDYYAAVYSHLVATGQP